MKQWFKSLKTNHRFLIIGLLFTFTGSAISSLFGDGPMVAWFIMIGSGSLIAWLVTSSIDAGR